MAMYFNKTRKVIARVKITPCFLFIEEFNEINVTIFDTLLFSQTFRARATMGHFLFSNIYR